MHMTPGAGTAQGLLWGSTQFVSTCAHIHIYINTDHTYVRLALLDTLI